MEMFYTIAVVFILIFLTTAWTSKRTWLMTDLVATTVFGLIKLVYPHVLLQTQTNIDFDSTHVFLTRIYATVILGSNVFYLLSRNSVDERVSSAVLSSRVLATSCMLLSKFYVQVMEKNSPLTDEHLYFGFLGTLLWLLGNLIHIILNRPPEHIQGGSKNMNAFLGLDYYATFLLGIAHLAFPQVVLLKLFRYTAIDGLHTHTTRLLGTMLIASALLSQAAREFTYDKDKQAVLLGRVLIPVLQLFVILYHHAALEALTVHQVLWMCGTLVGPALLNATLGIFMNPVKPPRGDKKYD
ncbi:uncharacterized protein LOC106179696 isoform X1 [Lingula anatina]|uniref:Uncharacterized protein LOC106179696 isoform X1 n=1 Tax=Lingula anatina TaxID=7574 RepID=A0A1S3K8B8_LINAN|nr:uncharacterized protein LOC106179696 isoform X1 [Lingula anatina]|eukprot:XP_013418880.1 uncharacterized protein LOC106179696 isoform X1 [Lingula anatina]